MAKSGTGPTGPRTPQGKARASQNARKHGIFVGRILPAEKKEASALYSAFQRELQPQGVVELEEMVGDMVLSRLQKRRIDKWMTSEFEKANVYNFSNWMEKKERRMARFWVRYSNARGGPYIEADCDRLPPEACLAVLTKLKDMIKKRGPLPDEDLDSLNRVYGTEFTEYGAILVSHYNQLKFAQDQCKEDDKSRELKREECRKEILEALEMEIQRQEGHLKVKTALDDMECAIGVPVPPPAPVLDLGLRYTSTNLSGLIKLLSAFERIRRLKGNT